MGGLKKLVAIAAKMVDWLDMNIGDFARNTSVDGLDVLHTASNDICILLMDLKKLAFFGSISCQMDTNKSGPHLRKIDEIWVVYRWSIGMGSIQLLWSWTHCVQCDIIYIIYS